MKKQMELFQENDEEMLCDYLQLHRQRPFNFKDVSENLGISKLRTLVAWNKLNEQNRLITLGDSPTYVLEALREGQHLPDYLTPASEYYRDNYYKPMARKLGFTLHDVLYQYAKHYNVSETEYCPEVFKNY